MHFLAEGRNDRIQRWIAEQVQSSKTEESSDEPDQSGQMTVHPLSPGGNEDSKVVGQMEELEIEMALTAYAFGRKNWPVSTGSIDTSILDFADLKRMSQLTIEQDIASELAEADSSELPRPHDRRRDARIVSQPPVIPPTPQVFDLPSPIIHRAVPAPAPIETMSRTSEIPPIAFVFQETASPGSNSIHFTPMAPDNLEAFPSTPRSFTSFLKHLSDASGHNQIKFQELFLSPRLITPKVAANTPKTPLSGAVASPMTLYSMESESCKSTPSLISAFPPTPVSTFPHHVSPRLAFGTKRETETMPPVPEAPSDSPNVADEIIVSLFETDSAEAFPPPPFPSPEVSQFFLTQVNNNDLVPTNMNANVSDQNPAQQSVLEKRDADILSDSTSDILSGQHSSRFSIFSSKFSVSSVEEPNKSTNDLKGNKWTSNIGKGSVHGIQSRSRATSLSSNMAGSKKSGHKSPISPPPRIGSRNEMMGQPGHSIHGHHSRAASKGGSRSESLTAPDLPAGPSSFDSSISEEISSSPEPQNMASAHPPAENGSGSVSEFPSHKTTNSKGRTFMSRISMGIRRSRSSGSNSSRPPRIQRNKTHAVTLSGSKVSEHVYFNTNASATAAGTSQTPNTSIPNPDNLSAVTSPSLQSSISPTVSLPSSKQQPSRLTLATQFGSTSTPPPTAIRYPLTPKTPASVSTSFFGESATSAEPLPTIKWRECLILRGVNRANKYDEPVIRWCEQLGRVEDILRVRGSGTIVVYFKEDDVMKKNRGVFEPREVNIAGVGIVTINWSRTMLPPERKPSS